MAVDESRIERFRTPKLHRWMLGVLADWLTIVLAICVAGYAHHWAVYIAAAIVIGSKQHALHILAHDGSHRLASPSPVLNDFVTNFFCFWPLGISLDGYRPFHFQHHKYTGMPNDPELEHKLWAAPEWDLPTNPWKIAYYLLKDLLGLSSPQLIILIKITKPPTLSAMIGPAVLIAAASALLISLGLGWVLLLWYGSFLTAYWAVFRMRIWTEHVGTGETHRIVLSWWQRWLFAPHNTWCHWEHHQWSWVPYWRLPEARDEDKSKPVRHMSDLIADYLKSKPIKSGMPLRTAHKKAA